MCEKVSQNLNQKSYFLQLLIWRLSVVCESPGDSLDSESNMYAWCLAVESVPPGDRCRAVRDEVLGAWRYVFSAKRFGGMMRLALEVLR